jgi:hypothetical protein
LISKSGNIRSLARNTLIILLLIGFSSKIHAQTQEAADSTALTHDFWSRYNVSGMITGGLVGGIFVYGWGVWWKNDYRSFRFWNDPQSYLNAHLAVDKAGHMFTGYFIFHSTNDILTWGGHDKDKAFWWATGLGTFHAFMVEIGDGFSEYGFDYQDMLSNWAGVGLGVLQQKVPFFSNVDMKWSLYYPMNKHAFIVNDLYDYHLYWLSFKVNNLLPKSIEPYWPDWLQVAVGYGAADKVTRREYVLSFDYDLEQIPLDGTDITLVKKLLNLIHLPAPGVKFSPNHHPEFRLLLLN